MSTPTQDADGLEALNSEIPFEGREGVLDRMVAKRIASLHDANLKPFVGPSPKYPPQFLKTKIKGQAVVSLRAGARGTVEDPAVVNASDPAFGESALAAIRRWRFLPRVRDGVASPATANLPFSFTPPP